MQSFFLRGFNFQRSNHAVGIISEDMRWFTYVRSDTWVQPIRPQSKGPLIMAQQLLLLYYWLACRVPWMDRIVLVPWLSAWFGAVFNFSRLAPATNNHISLVQLTFETILLGTIQVVVGGSTFGILSLSKMERKTFEYWNQRDAP